MPDLHDDLVTIFHYFQTSDNSNTAGYTASVNSLKSTDGFRKILFSSLVKKVIT